MQILITIPDESYNEIKKFGVSVALDRFMLMRAIDDGIIVPNDHGNLVDIDKLKDSYISDFWKAVASGNSSFDAIQAMTKVLDEAPVIIEKI